MANMSIQYEMNKPKEFKSGHFEAVLDCGFYMHNRWLETALKYLPKDITEQSASFLFTSTASRDACRIARHYCQTREIILISEHILPGQNVKDETNPKARYFIYVVLHEIVHAIKAHGSPLLDSLTTEESDAQEREADELAMKWFNYYVAQLNNKDILPITKEEIKEAQEKNRKVMRKLMDGK